ncbi:DUF1707 SHOCT-like domain-containing protein [Salinifilum ghardaiensis]
MDRDVRIGDSERQQAMRLLGEHFSAGRLELAEYDQRCQDAAAARFRSDLLPLFADLPSPRPDVLEPAAPAQARPPARSGGSGFPLRRVALIAGVALLGVALLLTMKQLGLVLLIPLVIALCSGAFRR